MADPIQSSGKSQAPDPSHAYERSHPGREAGLGDLHNRAEDAIPADGPDMMKQAVTHAQDPRQANGEDVIDGNGSRSRDPSPAEATNQPAVGDVRPQNPPDKAFQATAPR